MLPPKSNRREKRDYDRALYKLTPSENGFLEFKSVARVGNPLCLENGVVFGHLPAPSSDDLEQTLLTTPSRQPVVARASKRRS